MNKNQQKNGDILLDARGIVKSFRQGGKTLNVLDQLNMKIEAGEIAALVGPSGSGKSTLLQILGLLDKPDKGAMKINGKRSEKLNDKQRTKLRLETIGFVYQFHHLLPEFTAIENVALPQIILGVKTKHAKDKAAGLLDSLGLKDRLDHRPSALSGGEQQRVAIARALVNDPVLLLADEPTGNLDPDTSGEVFSILLEQVQNRKIGALIATHNLDLADQMNRVVELRAGKVMPL